MKRQRRWTAGLLAMIMVIGAVLATGCTDQQRGFELLIRGMEADTIRYAPGTVNYQVAVIERDGKYGLINYDGEIVVPIEHDSIWLGEPNYGMNAAMLRTNDITFEADGSVSDIETMGWGYEPSANPYWYNGAFTSYSEATELDFEQSWHPRTNRIGTVVFTIPSVIAVQEIRGFTTDEYGVKAVDLISEKYALMNYATKTLITDFIYEDCSHIGMVDGVLPVKKDGKWGYVNEKGEPLTAYCYDASEMAEDGVWPFTRLYASTNGYTVVRQGDRWGLIDNTGDTVLEPIYEDISQVNDRGEFWFKQNGTWSLARLIK